MSRRREANRAEAIVRGIGAIIMVLLLWGMVNGGPGFLGGKNPADAIAGVLTSLLFFAGVFGAVTVVGLVVWLVVLKAPRRPRSNIASGQSLSPPSPSARALSCADCGTSITTGIANYCQKRPRLFAGRSLCMSCQARYRR